MIMHIKTSYIILEKSYMIHTYKDLQVVQKTESERFRLLQSQRNTTRTSPKSARRQKFYQKNPGNSATWLLIGI
ncbi:hypothetical protein BH11BAC1_BH11BAC1_03810 [soil metagenome]